MSPSSTAPAGLSSSTAPVVMFTQEAFEHLSARIKSEFEKLLLQTDQGPENLSKKDRDDLQREYNRFQDWVEVQGLFTRGSDSLQTRVQKYEESRGMKNLFGECLRYTLIDALDYLLSISTGLDPNYKPKANEGKEYDSEGKAGPNKVTIKDNMGSATIGDLIRSVSHCFDQYEGCMEDLYPPTLEDISYRIRSQFDRLILEAAQRPDLVSQSPGDASPTEKDISDSFAVKGNHRDEGTSPTDQDISDYRDDMAQFQKFEGKHDLFLIKLQRARFLRWTQEHQLLPLWEENSLDKRVQENTSQSSDEIEDELRYQLRVVRDHLRLAIENLDPIDERQTEDSETDIWTMNRLSKFMHYAIYQLHESANSLPPATNHSPDEMSTPEAIKHLGAWIKSEFEKLLDLASQISEQDQSPNNTSPTPDQISQSVEGTVDGVGGMEGAAKHTQEIFNDRFKGKNWHFFLKLESDRFLRWAEKSQYSAPSDDPLDQRVYSNDIEGELRKHLSNMRGDLEEAYETLIDETEEPDSEYEVEPDQLEDLMRVYLSAIHASIYFLHRATTLGDVQESSTERNDGGA